MDQEQPSPSLRRSARLSKKKNSYESKLIPIIGEMRKVVPDLPPPHLRNYDKSKIKLRNTYNPNTGFSARFIAEVEAKQSAPSRAAVHHDFGATTRRQRLLEANHFKSKYVYGPNKDRKTGIWSAGGCHLWSEESSGFTWVAVHGGEQTCVVIRSIPPNPARLNDELKTFTSIKVWVHFLHSVVADMEDTTSEFHQMVDQGSQTSPFAVVSVVQGSDAQGSSSQVSNAGPSEEKCIQFLADKLRTGTTFSSTEIVQTTIAAMQFLCEQRFKPHEIVVCVLKTSEENGFGILSKSMVKDHLSTIM